ncbi:hypothetical protein [Staphylococcus phage SA3]|uniref:Uncharacterized protein n=8 Tax=Kayvirus TaxID=1857843 RepID=A0A3T0IDS3_9CAUD|nr:hypothetical protein F360_gp209 [Staphylococcus phage G15]ARQ96181.1 hypothetical protein qdsa002_225 [Staphylococcus phage qdsa002]ASZ78130.1 hypothetical protein [Staphylococcus phage SA3]AUG85633.1 hypothetical protein HSA30_gp129 [Staphylococcus phage HSA30]AXU40157.1 hypothetical protein VBSavMJYL01_155 [Staphylococcus phage VB_SavM_JYL01]AZU97563.1 hypothetical protein VBSavMJYL02_151 [Staphylococcus phage VB-SavM-JYL02]QEQ93201.1 hypothetical protein [Staphylococcus phage vB_SauH_IM
MYILERTIKGFVGQKDDILPYYFRSKREIVHFLKLMEFRKKETNYWVKKNGDFTIIIRAKKLLYIEEYIQKLKEWENDL